MSRILSPLLSTRENGLLFSLLSHDCILACGVVQLVLAAPPQKKEWKSHSFGVACLVQDKGTHLTFIKLYCLKKARLVWEQQLYASFQYSEARPYFHTFSGDECQAGLNFADEEEAKLFFIAVQKQISDNKARSPLTRSYSVGSISQCKEKLESCLGASKMLNRQPSFSGGSRVHVDLETLPEIKPSVSMSSQVCDSQTFSSTDEDSVWLAKKKGPLPPLPPCASVEATKLSDSTHQIPPWAPPPPSFAAPKVPPKAPPKAPPTAIKKSASFAPVKDHSSYVKRIQSFHFNAGLQDESN